MLIIPSIYIRNGETVALASGGRLFNKDPVEMAKELAAVGAELLYVADLDTPSTGHIPNLFLIEKIVKETGLKIQLTGNIKSSDVVERYIKAGVERVVLGVVAYQKPEFLKNICKKFPGKIAVHIDVRGGKVVIKGWTVAAKKTSLDYAKQFKDAGVFTILYSDVDEEGKITANDIIRVRDFLRKAPMPLIHATDILSNNDLSMVLELESPRIIGTIVGRSMYSGAIDIASSITHAKENVPSGMDEPTLIP